MMRWEEFIPLILISLMDTGERPEETADEKGGQYALFHVFRALPHSGGGGE
jgi:hypothetical protein